MPDATADSTTPTEAFRAARDLLLDRATDYHAAVRDFTWPRPATFNWALDWFDVIARGSDAVALWIVEEDGSEQKLSYAELSRRSDQLANWLREQGVRRGDRLLLMLGNQVELWESILAAIKLGAVIIPASTLLGPADLADRIERGAVAHVITNAGEAGKFAELSGDWTPVAVGGPVAGWLDYAAYREAPAAFTPDGVTRADDPLLLYFTSGTTAQPKLVEHTQVSYPIGHLSTMYWIGLRPGDVHLNISSPGWAKHAWSNVFAPLNAEATILIYNYTRFAAGPLLDQLARCQVTTFCAPPTVWRLLIQADLAAWRRGAGAGSPLRHCLSAGEPLNPEVIDQVRRAWDITIRDGYGQTETTAQIGNTPGQQLKPGSMGRPLPGYSIELVDPVTGEPGGDEGEICIELARRPLALMTGYRDDAERDTEAMRGGYYHTGDVATRDDEGYITYVGRTDDVFKASDYRISPFELESELLGHEAVAEAAVVPSPDPVRLAVPKAYITLVDGHAPDAGTARSIFAYSRANLAPYKRLRMLEFAELPKTISGKIRRVELRRDERAKHGTGADSGVRGGAEFYESDFPDLRDG